MPLFGQVLAYSARFTYYDATLRSGIFSHRSKYSVIINNLHVAELIAFTHEADAVLIVDPNAVLSLSIAAQRFKTVPRRYSQIIQVRALFMIFNFRKATR